MKKLVLVILYQLKNLSVTSRRIEATFFMAVIIAFFACPLFSDSSEISELEARYLNLPADLQLDCAEYKMGRCIEKLRTSGSDHSKLKKLEQGMAWLKKAIQKHSEFTGPLYYTENLNPSDSPLSMMKHLWLAEDGVKQTMYGWERSPRSPKTTIEKQKVLTQAIKDASEAIEKAIKEAEAFRDWTKNTDGMFFSLEAPSEFKPYKNPSQRLNLQVVSPENQTEKALLVSVEKENKNIKRWEYQDSIIARVQKKFPDMRVIDRNMAFPGISGRWFSYEYTWEGKKIRGLVYHYIGSWIWEITYLTLTEKFDKEECEGIIRSLRRK